MSFDECFFLSFRTFLALRNEESVESTGMVVGLVDAWSVPITPRFDDISSGNAIGADGSRSDDLSPE